MNMLPRSHRSESLAWLSSCKNCSRLSSRAASTDVLNPLKAAFAAPCVSNSASPIWQTKVTFERLLNFA